MLLLRQRALLLLQEPGFRKNAALLLWLSSYQGVRKQSNLGGTDMMQKIIDLPVEGNSMTPKTAAF